MISRAERSSRTGMAVIFPIMRATRLRRSSVASGEASRGRRNRSLSPSEDLDEILAWREERTVTQNLTLHYDRMMLPRSDIIGPRPRTQESRSRKLHRRPICDTVERGRSAVQIVR